MESKATEKKPTVLLVEDDFADQRIIKRLVDTDVFRVQLDIVDSGERALEYVQRESVPDLILLDLNMPGIGGIETLTRMRALNVTKTVPIIVLTTSDSETDIIRSYEHGANSYVTKPIDYEEFCHVMREIGEYWFDVIVLPPARGAVDQAS